MEVLENKIKKFLTIDKGFGYGFGFGCGFSNFYGNGDGSGMGCGCGASDKTGSGDGCGSGYSDCSGDGSGGNSYGSSNHYGDGIKAINGNKVYMIDNTLTIFKSIHGNVAKGYILQSDWQLKPCFIVKENNKFAHGHTLRDTFISLQEKLYDDSTEEERIEAFKKKFPEYDVKYDNVDLFTYHHVLTGSCRIGREAFVLDRGLSLDGKTSIREFVELTKNAYGGDIIKKLPEAYGIE